MTDFAASAPETADEATERQPRRRVRSRPVSQIPLKRRQYLWDQRVPLGEVTLWVGHAGIGKSQAAVWLAAHVSRGTLPGELNGAPSPVLYLGTEDSWSYTLAPRFAAARADLDQVHQLYAETDEGTETVVSLSIDLDLLREEIERTGARLVVLDALLSTMGGDDLVKQGVVRRHLEPLARLAQELNIAVVGVAHFRKAGGADPLHMIAGSAEFGQVVRSAIGFARDTEADDGTCVLSLIKTNIAPQGLTSVRYRVDPAIVETPEGPTDVGQFVPLGDTDQTIGELLNRVPETSEERSERSEAVEWLISYLTSGGRGGEAEAGEVFKAAERDGFQKRTIQRARSKAGVTTRRSDKAWLWSYSPGDEQGDTFGQGDTSRNTVTSEDVKASEDANGAVTLSPCHLDPSPSSLASSSQLRSVSDPGCDQCGATPSRIAGSKRLCADHRPNRNAA